MRLKKSPCLLQSCQVKAVGLLPVAACSPHLLHPLPNTCLCKAKLQGSLGPANPPGAGQQWSGTLGSTPALQGTITNLGLYVQQHVPGSSVPQGPKASLEQGSRCRGFARGLRLSPSLCHPFEKKELKIG